MTTYSALAWWVKIITFFENILLTLALAQFQVQMLQLMYVMLLELKVLKYTKTYTKIYRKTGKRYLMPSTTTAITI